MNSRGCRQSLPPLPDLSRKIEGGSQASMEGHNFLMWLFIITCVVSSLCGVVSSLCLVVTSLCLVVTSLCFVVTSLCLVVSSLRGLFIA